MVDNADDHPGSGTWSGLHHVAPVPRVGTTADAPTPPFTLARESRAGSVIAVFQTRPDGTCASIDAAWLELTGLEPEQALGSHVWLPVHPADRVAVARAWHRAVAVARPVHLQIRLVTPSGTTRWIELRARPRLGGRAAREPSYTTVAIEVRAPADAVGTREVPTLTAGVSELPEGTMVVNPDGVIVDADHTAAEIFGCSAPELLGTSVNALLHPSEHEPDRRILAGAISLEPRRISHELRLPDAASGQRWVQMSAAAGPVVRGRSTGVTVTVTDITLRRNAERRLAELALHDTLTGLPNRALIKERLRAATERAARSGSLVAVLFIDLDSFKLVNDLHGHAAGDTVLVEVARRIEALTRHDDTTGRLAGDEFVVVCEHLASGADAEWLAGRVRTALERPFDIDGTQHRVTASIGIALASGTVADPDELLWAADTAMYEAKAAGPGRSAVRHEASGTRELAARSSRDALADAIERGAVDVRFEPVMALDAPGDPPTAYAAIGSWRRTDGSVLSHGELTNLAEQHGLGLILTSHVLRQACVLACAVGTTPGLTSVSVPVTARQLLQPRLTFEVHAALTDHALRPASLALDIAAPALLHASELAGRQLGELRELGVRLALDDFGARLGPLWHLDHERFDTVNLSEHLVHRLGDDHRARAVARAIVTTAHELGIATVARGVHVPVHLEAVRDVGCQRVRGTLFATAERSEIVGTAGQAGHGRGTPARGPSER